MCRSVAGKHGKPTAVSSLATSPILLALTDCDVHASNHLPHPLSRHPAPAWIPPRSGERHQYFNRLGQALEERVHWIAFGGGARRIHAWPPQPRVAPCSYFLLLLQACRWAVAWPVQVSLILHCVEGHIMVNIALGLGLVLEQNFEDPDSRAVLGQVDTARCDGAGLSRSIRRWAASRGERTGLLRVSVFFAQ